LAVLQGPDPLNPDAGLFYPQPGNRITIYDAITGRVRATYQGDFASIAWNWSPDGRKILYRNQRLFEDDDQTKLCILYLDNDLRHCIDRIQNTNLSSFTFFSWSDDAEKVYFINYTNPPGRSDLCVYGLQTTAIDCPTENMVELNDLNVEGYTPSPSGEFFLISYGRSCNTCDVWGEPSIAIVPNDGNGFIFIGKQVMKHIGDDRVIFPAFWDGLWKPIPES
jgi:hypothetical protein